MAWKMKKKYLIWRLQNTISVQLGRSFCHDVQFVVCYLKGDWVHMVDFQPFFTMGDKLCDYLFVSQYAMYLLKRVYP